MLYTWSARNLDQLVKSTEGIFFLSSSMTYLFSFGLQTFPEMFIFFLFFREGDITDIDPSYACQTLKTMKTLNMAKCSEESISSIICCPVRNERSENVIGRFLRLATIIGH